MDETTERQGTPQEVASFLLNTKKILDDLTEYVPMQFISVFVKEDKILVELYGVMRIKLEDVPQVTMALRQNTPISFDTFGEV